MKQIQSDMHATLKLKLSKV